MVVVALVFNLGVAARLLLDEQPQVAGQQVGAALQAQSLAYERGFEQGLLSVVLAAVEEQAHGLANVLQLFGGVALEPLGFEVLAGAEAQRLLAEGFFQ